MHRKNMQKKKTPPMSTGYRWTCKNIVLKLHAVTARTTHSECHSLYISSMSFYWQQTVVISDSDIQYGRGLSRQKKWSEGKGNNLSNCRWTWHNQNRNQWAEGRCLGKLLGNNAPPKGFCNLFCSSLVLSMILPDDTSLFMPINSHSNIWLQC